MPLSRSERKLRARAAAHTMHARNDVQATTKAGRDAFLARFEREVDPDETLDLTERSRRAEHARRAHFAALALKSATARRKRREQSSGNGAA